MNVKNKIIFAVRTVGGFCLKFLHNQKGRLGLLLVSIVVIAAIFAPYLTPYELDNYDIANGLAKPSAEHWLGTDKNGVDILTQIFYGARISLIIGVTTGLCVTFLGATLGVVSAYFGKVSAGVILNMINVLLVVPTTPLMMIMSNLSSSYVMMIAVFTLLGWCGTARMVRAQVLSIMNMNYIRAAELAGGSKNYIMFRHIMPAVSHLLIMNCALSCAGFMIAEAGLSFIGLGDPSVMSWGKILVAAQESAFTSGLWAWVAAPGAAIFITVFGFMQIGSALEEILNPKMKQKKLKADLIQVRLGGLGREVHRAKHDKFISTSLQSTGGFILEGDFDSLRDELFASMTDISEEDACALKEKYTSEVQRV